MGYYNKLLGGAIKMDRYVKIDGIAMPEISEPVKFSSNNVSDGGRLADNIDFEGSLKGVKKTIELHYRVLDKEHFDIIYNATQGRYNNGGDFFMNLTVPTYTPEGVKTFRVYFMSTFDANCTDTTEKHGRDNSYWQGGANYDELHENVVFKFVEK